jgi:hypothetical protein
LSVCRATAGVQRKMLFARDPGARKKLQCSTCWLH